MSEGLTTPFVIAGLLQVFTDGILLNVSRYRFEQVLVAILYSRGDKQIL